MRILGGRIASASLALAGITLLSAPSNAQDFSNIYIFGGSYSDAGAYIVDGEQRRWTINPAPVWNQLLGQSYGIPVSAYETVQTQGAGAGTVTVLGGSNYGQGGARVDAYPGEFTYNVLSVTDQLITHLSANGGLADPNALYSLEGGGNDIFFWTNRILTAINAGASQAVINLRIAEAEVAITNASDAFIALIEAITTAGAQHVLVLNIHDIGRTPVATSASAAAQTYLTDNAAFFNANVKAWLYSNGSGNVIFIDTFRFLDELIDSGAAYGFTNTSDPACSVSSAIDCTTSTISPGASASTYLFSDDVHPSGPGHLALSQYIQSIISAPGLVGLVAEAPIASGQGIFRTLDSRLFDQRGGPPGFSVFATGDAGGLVLGGDAPDPGLGGGAGSFHGGVQYGLSERFNLGAFFSASLGSYDFSSDRGDYRMGMQAGTLWASARAGNSFAQLSGTIGALDYSSITRSFDVYQGSRSNSGSTEGAFYSARILAGHDVALGDVTFTPIAALSYQKVNVDGYSEDQTDSSTMVFGDQTRELLYATIGGRLSYETTVRGVPVRPGISASLNYDFLDQSRSLTAGLADPGTILFSMPAYQPDRSWLDLGGQLAADLNAHVTLGISAGGKLAGGDLGYWGDLRLTFRLGG